MALKIAGPGKVDKAFCCSAGSVPNGTASTTGTLSVNLFTVPVHLRIHHQPPPSNNPDGSGPGRRQIPSWLFLLQKSHLFGVWPYSFPKDVCFFVVFPRKKLVFGGKTNIFLEKKRVLDEKTNFFLRKQLVLDEKTMFFLGKSWCFHREPIFSSGKHPQTILEFGSIVSQKMFYWVFWCFVGKIWFLIGRVQCCR